MQWLDILACGKGKTLVIDELRNQIRAENDSTTTH